MPTAIALLLKGLVQPPRSWTERTCYVTRYAQVLRVGHFAPPEQPGFLANDLAASSATCADERDRRQWLWLNCRRRS
jgi:hypothetical protein